MPNLIFLSDCHLNFLSFQQNRDFLDSVCLAVNPGDSVVITGDIAEGPSVRLFVVAWEMAIRKKGGSLYFVLGNHDFYNDSILRVRKSILEKPALKGAWLVSAGLVNLGTGTDALVGHDGWYDGLYASWMASRVWLNDYDIIKELGPILAGSKIEKLKKCQELAREAADHVSLYADKAASEGKYRTVYIATHVPPFKEACVYQGKVSDDNWMPHFSSKMMGDAILDVAQKNPSTSFVVLCGHTHGRAECQPAPNVVCHTAYAEYRYPGISQVFNL